jgi:hypothetical protein
MNGLPIRKDGRLYSGRSAATLVTRALEQIDGNLRVDILNDALVRNEVETLAKQRDTAFHLARSLVEAMRNTMSAVKLIPEMAEDDPNIDALAEIKKLVAVFGATDIFTEEGERMLAALDDPFKTSQAEGTDTPKYASVSGSVLENEGGATGVCDNCGELVRRLDPTDDWFHVRTGSFECASA